MSQRKKYSPLAISSLLPLLMNAVATLSAVSVILIIDDEVKCYRLLSPM